MQIYNYSNKNIRNICKDLKKSLRSQLSAAIEETWSAGQGLAAKTAVSPRSSPLRTFREE